MRTGNEPEFATNEQHNVKKMWYIVLQGAGFIFELLLMKAHK